MLIQCGLSLLDSTLVPEHVRSSELFPQLLFLQENVTCLSDVLLDTLEPFLLDGCGIVGILELCIDVRLDFVEPRETLIERRYRLFIRVFRAQLFTRHREAPRVGRQTRSCPPRRSFS